MTSPASYDAIVIGAGMSGLAAAIRLAMFDKRVVVLERHGIPGGLNSYYHRSRRPFDVGLHALTNYAAQGARGAPLTKLLRQLRIPWEALRLREQLGSEVRFPGVTLAFTNDFQVLRHSVREAFPAHADAFDRLSAAVNAYDNLSLDVPERPVGPFLEEHISDPLLREMLLCPLMYYGSAVEDGMELGQFCTMWKSIFQEGFARPEGGVRTVVKLLVDRLKEAGGELRFKRGVQRILTRGGRAVGVRLENGEELTAPAVISTAGWFETLAMTDEAPPPAPGAGPGRMTFLESILCLKVQPRELGIDQTIVFFNDSERFHYRPPEDYLDLRSGVVCLSNNYRDQEPLPEGLLRITSIASWERWSALEKPEPYQQTKLEWHRRQVDAIRGLFPSFSDHVVCVDVFTPTTIHHYPRHLNGAVYGAPVKARTGLTPVQGLFVAGTDQGFLGVVGAMLSGISIANARVLMAGAVSPRSAPDGAALEGA